MSYTPATQFPAHIKFFQWNLPSAPNPRLASAIEETDTILTFTSPPKDKDSIIRGDFVMNSQNEDGYTEQIYIPAGTLPYSSQTANFTVGTVLTGGTSGATAIVTADSDSGTTGTLILGNLSGTFQSGEVITDNDGGSATTSDILTESISADGLTASNCVRGVRLEGLDWFTGDSTLAAKHGADSPIGCSVSPVLFRMMRDALNGTIFSGGANWRIGRDKDENITVYANNGDVNPPYFRYYAATNKWVYSNNGVDETDFGLGAGVTSGDGIATIIGGLIAIDLMNTPASGVAVSGIEISGGKMGVVKDLHWTTDFAYGANISAYNVLYNDSADAKWKLADANGSGAYDRNTLGIALEAGVDTDTDKKVALPGSIITGLSGLTAGLVYLSDTAGAMSSGAGTNQVILGYAPNATTLYFNPAVLTGTQAGSLIDGTDANDKHIHEPIQNLRKINRVTINIDGSNFSTSGTGAVTEYSGIIKLDTGSSSGGRASFGMDTNFGVFNGSFHSDSPRFICTAIFSESSNQNSLIGMANTISAFPNNSVYTGNHAAFIVDDGNIYASVANGSSQALSSALGTTLTNRNIFSIEESGGNYLFYINNSLVHTSNGNEPIATLYSGGASIESTESLDKILSLSSPKITFTT